MDKQVGLLARRTFFRLHQAHKLALYLDSANLATSVHVTVTSRMDSSNALYVTDAFEDALQNLIGGKFSRKDPSGVSCSEHLIFAVSVMLPFTCFRAQYKVLVLNS